MEDFGALSTKFDLEMLSFFIRACLHLILTTTDFDFQHLKVNFSSHSFCFQINLKYHYQIPIIASRFNWNLTAAAVKSERRGGIFYGHSYRQADVHFVIVDRPNHEDHRRHHGEDECVGEVIVKRQFYCIPGHQKSDEQNQSFE